MVKPAARTRLVEMRQGKVKVRIQKVEGLPKHEVVTYKQLPAGWCRVACVTCKPEESHTLAQNILDSNQ